MVRTSLIALMLPYTFTSALVMNDVNKRSDNLIPRANPPYKTHTSYAQMTIKYGNIGPGALMQNLKNVCLDSTGLCNDENTGPLSVPTKVYVADNAVPLDATLTLSPESNFGIGEATFFVNAVAGVAAAGKQCETHSWRDEGAVRSGLGDGVGTDTFCSMSNEIQVRKTDATTGDEISSLKVGVSIEIDPGQSFDWCSLADLSSTIAGVFEGGAGLSGFFGVSAWFCDTATGN